MRRGPSPLPALVGQCRSIPGSAAFSSWPRAETFPGRQAEGVGRQLATEHACEAVDPADTVCFLLCHFSVHTHLKKKKKSRNIWQAGEGLALSANKEPSQEGNKNPAFCLFLLGVHAAAPSRAQRPGATSGWGESGSNS